MPDATCPKCGANLQAAMIGERLKDKVLLCPYCRHQLDVPDEFESSICEESVGPQGTTRRVVTERRRDLSGTDAPAASGVFEAEDGPGAGLLRGLQESGALDGGPFDPQQVFEQLKRSGALPPNAQPVPGVGGVLSWSSNGGEVITHSVVSDRAGGQEAGLQALSEQVRAQMDQMSGGRFGQLAAGMDLQHLKPNEVRTHQVETSSFSTSPMPDPRGGVLDDPDPTVRAIKWGIAAAVVLALLALLRLVW